MTISWSIDTKTSPCYQYKIEISHYENIAYKNVNTYLDYKPEQTKYVYNSSLKGKYQIIVTCDGISNQSVSKTIEKEI